jgi:hypothetical protein
VGDGLVHAVHELGRDDLVEELAAEVVGGGLDRAGDLEELAFGADLDTGAEQVLDQDGAVLGVEAPVHQEAFGCAADAGAACLGVQDHSARLLEVGVLVGVDVADAFEVGEDGNPRLALDEAHEALAAARDDHVDVAHGPQHGRDRRAVAGGDELDRVLGEARLAEAPLEAFVDGLERVQALAAAPQDHRVAGLEAEGAPRRGRRWGANS